MLIPYVLLKSPFREWCNKVYSLQFTVYVVVEAEINITRPRNFDEKAAMHSSDEDLSTDERTSGVKQMFMASEEGPVATQGVEIELKRRKVAIHCSNEVSE